MYIVKERLKYEPLKDLDCYPTGSLLMNLECRKGKWMMHLLLVGPRGGSIILGQLTCLSIPLCSMKANEKKLIRQNPYQVESTYLNSNKQPLDYIERVALDG